MSQIEKLLQKEMTRKQFIVAAGMACLSIFGFSTIIGLLTKSTSTPHKSDLPGYGTQNYGP